MDLSLGDIYLIVSNRYERCPIANYCHHLSQANLYYTQAITRFGLLFPETWSGQIVISYTLPQKKLFLSPEQTLKLNTSNPFALFRLYLLICSNGFHLNPDWAWLIDYIQPNIRKYLRVYSDLRSIDVPIDVNTIQNEWFEWTCLKCGALREQREYYRCGHGVCLHCSPRGCTACRERIPLGLDRPFHMDTKLYPAFTWIDRI